MRTPALLVLTLSLAACAPGGDTAAPGDGPFDTSPGEDSVSGDVASTAPDGTTTADTETAGLDGSTPTLAACPAPLNDGVEGPLYGHQVQRATSTDGVHFMVDDTILLAHASVPDAVVRPDGSVWLYFVNGVSGQHGPFIAELGDDGLFEVIDCVRVDGLFEGDAVDPNIQRLEDGRYRLDYFLGWFTDGPPPPDAVFPFYVAFSDDGVSFTNAAITFESESMITDPSVIMLPDGGWLMALAKHDEGVVLASSDDGLAFTPTGVTVDMGIPELFAFEDGTVRLYVSGMGGMIVYASDDGGATFTAEHTTTVGGADPSLIEDPQGGWIMYRKTFAPGSGPGGPPPSP